MTTMRALFVLAHPEPRSFNGAMHRAGVTALRARGWAVDESDLCAQQFNPVSDRRNFTTVANPDYLKLQFEEAHASQNDGFAPDLEAEMRKVEAADLLVFQFPLWWFGMPAILKGWVDRVFAMGRFYGGGRARFAGRKAMVSTTTGGPREFLSEGGGAGDLMGILRPIHRGVFEFVGYDVLAPQVTYGPARIGDEARAAALAEWTTRLATIEQEAAIDVGEY